MVIDIQKSFKVRLLVPAAIVLLDTITGTIGYLWLGRDQGATFLDALFMTVITITTIGYGEVIKLNDAGRIFTMVIAVVGIGGLFYSFTVVMDNLVSIRLADPYGTKKMQNIINELSNHVVIAGLGRVGRQAATELAEAKMPFVIVDSSSEAHEMAHQLGFLLVSGDATDDAILEQAGISRATGLIVTTSDDASNLYIVLSARVLNPTLFIVSRAVDDSNIPKLTRAGANRAISPYAIGGRRLAHLILSPAVVDFFDTVIKRGEESINIESVKIDASSHAVNKTLASLDLMGKTGANILVVLRGNGVLPNPDPNLTLSAEDQLLALGTTTQLDSLEKLLCAKNS